MPRSLSITVPADRSSALVQALKAQRGLLSLSLQRGASVQPPGDVVTVLCLNRHYASMMQVLEHQRIGREPGTSFSSSEPISVVASTTDQIPVDSSASSWEEMELTLMKESHLTADVAFLMFVAGFAAAAGVITGAVHVVIGAMVIAPGFEPFVRIALGGLTHSGAWRRGLFSTAVGYLVLVVGAACAAWLLAATGQSLLSGPGTYHATQPLVDYWTTFSTASVVVSALAAIAGALLVVSHRSVLTAGVMIALALVPAAALIPVALIGGDATRAGWAALRWSTEAALVLGAGWGVLAWKRHRDGRQRMLL
jgi:hypothetical protein